VALWPNNFSNLRGFSRISFSGDAGLGMSQQRTQRQLSFFVNDTISPTASIPEGSFESRMCVLAPLIAGGMSSGNSSSNTSINANGLLVSGAPISGTATILLDEDGASLSLVIALSGVATITLTTANAVLSLTIGLSGEATWTLTSSANLGMIVPFSGSGMLSVNAIADLKGLLSMSGESSSFTPLSPESLARAVWSVLASANNEPNSMGEKLNSVATAEQIAAAILSAASTTPIAANSKRINDAVVYGHGTEANLWRGTP
jgi:hypothetical protein